MAEAVCHAICEIIERDATTLWNLLPRSSFWILPAANGQPHNAPAQHRNSAPRPTTAQK